MAYTALYYHYHQWHKKKTINTLSKCIWCFCGIPICVMSVVLAFFSAIFSFLVSLLSHAHHHHHHHHRSPIHLSNPFNLVAKCSIQHIIPSVTIKYLHVWAKRCVCVVCVTHTVTEQKANVLIQRAKREKRKKRIMLAFKWDREKLKIYRCQKWRQAYKTKLTETDARTKKNTPHTLTHCERAPKPLKQRQNVCECVRVRALSEQLHKFVENNFLFFAVRSSSLGICNDVLTT